MSHMFIIEYLTNHVNGMVEAGKVIVVADSHEQASDVVCQQLQLPASRTRCESTKIKPPCYPLETHESYPEKKRVPMYREREPETRTRWSVTVTASHVVGQNERQVLCKVAEDLIARARQTRLRHHLEMSVDCSETNPPAGRTGMMEKIELLRPTGGRVQGGPMRGK